MRDEIGQVRDLMAAKWAEGKLKGKVDLLLRMLASAGLVPGEQERARLQGCTDEATLDRWADNFLRGARSLADVLS